MKYFFVSFQGFKSNFHVQIVQATFYKDFTLKLSNYHVHSLYTIEVENEKKSTPTDRHNLRRTQYPTTFLGNHFGWLYIYCVTDMIWGAASQIPDATGCCQPPTLGHKHSCISPLNISFICYWQK